MTHLRSDNVLKDFYIPDYILVPGSNVGDSRPVPCCPVIVFINTKSGGQLGGELLITYQKLLNKNQVFFFGGVILILILCTIHVLDSGKVIF